MPMQIEPPRTRMLVKLGGHWMPALVTKRPDGYYDASIAHADAWPIRDQITISSMGIEYRNMQELCAIVPVEQLARIRYLLSAFEPFAYLHTSHMLPAKERGKMIWQGSDYPMIALHPC